MPGKFFFLLAVSLLAACAFAPAALAQVADEMRVGDGGQCVSAPTSSVRVPVYIRDVGGTPLGSDRPPGQRIQGLSMQIKYSPAAAITRISFQRAGVLAGKVPISEFGPSQPGSLSYIGLFEETFNLLNFRTDAAPPGDLIAELVITLSEAAIPGTRIEFTFGPATTTALTNQTALVSETTDNGSLRVFGGCVEVPAERPPGERKRAVRRG